MRRPTATHIKLLKCAENGDSMFGAVRAMNRSEATVQKLWQELVDANMIEYDARDEPMQLTRLGRAVLKGGVGTFRIRKTTKRI